MTDVPIKWVDISRNTKCEGNNLGFNWRWGTKVWGAKRIRDPCSPDCKRCMLGVRELFFSAVGNPLNIPPEDYGRKTKTQIIWRFGTKSEAHVV